MQNRDRDRISQSKRPTDAGEVNKRTEEERGLDRNSGTGARFGQGSGRSERNEGGQMRNRNEDQVNDKDMNNEPSKREEGGSFDSSTGRERIERESDVSRDESSERPERPMGNRSDRSDSSEGRH